MSKNKKDTTIIFNKNNLSKVLKVNQDQIRQFFFALSLLIVSLIVSIVLTVVFYNNKFDSIEESRSTYHIELEAKNQQLLEENKKWEEEVSSLQKKLVAPPNLIDNLSLFPQTAGFKDLTEKKLIELDNLKTEFETGSTTLKFDILNTQKTPRVSGFIYVLQYSTAGIQLFPKPVELNENLFVNYFDGESFNVARFRPFIAKFDTNSKVRELYYKILIFSKTGDLITYQKVGPLNTKDLNK